MKYIVVGWGGISEHINWNDALDKAFVEASSCPFEDINDVEVTIYHVVKESKIPFRRHIINEL